MLSVRPHRAQTLFSPSPLSLDLYSITKEWRCECAERIRFLTGEHEGEMVLRDPSHNTLEGAEISRFQEAIGLIKNEETKSCESDGSLLEMFEESIGSGDDDFRPRLDQWNLAFNGNAAVECNSPE